MHSLPTCVQMLTVCRSPSRFSITCRRTCGLLLPMNVFTSMFTIQQGALIPRHCAVAFGQNCLREFPKILQKCHIDLGMKSLWYRLGSLKLHRAVAWPTFLILYLQRSSATEENRFYLEIHTCRQLQPIFLK